MTLFDKNAIQKDCKGATYFPSGARIITTSINSLAKVRKFEIDEYQLDFMLDYHEREFYINNGAPIRNDGHYYIDKVNDKLCYCEDRIYIRSNKDFIYNNFGTEKDNFLLENKDEGN